ncbi:ATP-binding protein [Streptomyces sp. NPDC046385]|uniref:ATP-binding protein n=1 Tax=Streptomyces sp. NPDC046385 TaxID=3154918 RepID=UPI0033C54693
MTRLQEAPPPSGDTDSPSTATRSPAVGAAQEKRQDADARVALPTEPSDFQTAFLPAPQRVKDIRQATAAFLRRSGVPQETADDVVLVVSELVTNAVRHGQGEISLRALASNGRVAITVSTQGSGRAVVREADLDAESGRGMFLVDALTDSWGVATGMTWCILRYAPDDGTVAA